MIRMWRERCLRARPSNRPRLSASRLIRAARRRIADQAHQPSPTMDATWHSHPVQLTWSPGIRTAKRNVFVHDLQTGATTLVSVNSSGEQADGGGGSPDISGDGRYVVFLSDSNNLYPGADEYKALVYVHDRQNGQTTLASVYTEGQIMVTGLLDQPTISSNGRYVAFSFYDKGDNNGIMNIWVRDLQMGASIRMTGSSSFGPSLSADGSIVAFWSSASTWSAETQTEPTMSSSARFPMLLTAAQPSYRSLLHAERLDFDALILPPPVYPLS